MTPYLLIETRTASESKEVADFLVLAAALADAGSPVDLFLIQNGVLMAFAGVEPQLAELLSQPGLTVWVDDFSLASRAATNQALLGGVRVGGAATLVELLTRPGCKPTWH
jgi:predicted peroxiredoxin